MGKQTIDWSQMLTQLEQLAVESQHLAVKNSLHALPMHQIPRSHVAPFAELAWRISEPILTLKLLNKILFPENHLAQDATDREKFIYATALANLGAVDEALQLFDSIRSEKEPEVHLRKALAYFRVWNYKAARPLLEKFLKQSELPPYRHLIGQVNLAAALISECVYDEAHDLLQEIEATCRKNNYVLLLGNTFELQAQIQFFKKNYPKALGLLDQAMNILKSQGGEFYIYAEKWKVICEAYQNPCEASLQALRDFRQKAQSLLQPETVRECDLFEAALTQNEDLFRKVILGTPVDYYRQRARRLFGKNISAQGHFHWALGQHQDPQPVHVFSPYEIQRGQESLHMKPLLLALFEALTVDFYRPSHIGLLFQRIYKGEKFNPFSSPNRVLGLIKRLDQWFADQDVPLRVQMKKSEFALIPFENKAVHILVQRSKSLSKQDGYLSQLRELFSGRSFSAQAVSSHLQISKASAQNLIFQGVKDGAIAKKGVGRATTYVLMARNKKKVAA